MRLQFLEYEKIYFIYIQSFYTINPKMKPKNWLLLYLMQRYVIILKQPNNLRII